MIAWWVWLLVGLGLLVVEAITPGGFFFLFFAVSAIVVGLLASVFALPDWLLLCVFSGLSVGSLLLFRGPLLRLLKAREHSPHAVDSMTGETVELTQDVAPYGTGQALMRGTVWSVRNAGPQRLTTGQHCRVERVEGLTLIVLAHEAGERRLEGKRI